LIENNLEQETLQTPIEVICSTLVVSTSEDFSLFVAEFFESTGLGLSSEKPTELGKMVVH
jgi:hypothetical protein